MEILPGRYDSVTLSFRRAQFHSQDDYRQIQQDLRSEILARLPDVKGAIFIDIPERYLGKLIDTVTNMSFVFHRQQDKVYTYYLWAVKNSDGTPKEDKVPTYATATEGVGGLIFSPDHTQVLLVWEYGKWKVVTGSLKAGERLMDTLAREIKEEVGLTINPHRISYLGGWHDSKADFGLINNNFRIFAVEATSLDFHVDNDEIHDARWFSTYDLYAIASQPCPGPNPMSAVDAYDTKFSWLMLQWLNQGSTMGPRLHIFLDGKITCLY